METIKRKAELAKYLQETFVTAKKMDEQKEDINMQTFGNYMKQVINYIC